MTVIFAHDHRFIPHDGSVYSEFQFPETLWRRYRNAFGGVTVVARREEMPKGKSLDQLELSSRGDVPFTLLPNLSTPLGLIRHRKEAIAIIDDQIHLADALIARLPSEVGLLAIARARRLRKPYLIEVAGCTFDGLWNHGSPVGKLYAPVSWWRNRRAIASASHVVYVTREFLQMRYPCSGRTTACSNVELPPISPEILPTRLSRVDGPSGPGGRFVVGLIGSLRSRVKGVQTMLAALAADGELRRKVIFRVLGSGDPTPWQREAASLGLTDQEVRFDGTLPTGEPVFRWLDDVDIYIQPSLKEGLPRALIEAMSRGCPALGTRRAGIPELLEDDCLVPPGDAQALGAAVLRAIGDAAWRRQQVLRNIAVAEHYTSDHLDRVRAEFFADFIDREVRRRSVLVAGK